MITEAVSFWVAGTPTPQGSLRAFMVGSRPIVTSTNRQRLGDWRTAIATEARARFSALLVGPVEVQAVFYLPRPASRRKRDQHPDRKPDLDKLARAVLDALTSVAFKDDAQVTRLDCEKRYAAGNEQPGVRVRVTLAT
ncbi:MAG: RusA family crossover junction endodeoxyribonuclease [Gemmatimonadaceae bacterium]|nr:RusA family crossover junction endodeoxyribonuclease [Gemmatimonadaceae bacterium]